jgi:chromosome segregation ATPase
MTQSATQSELKQPLELVNRAISSMQTLSAQLDEVDDLKQEIARAKRDVETWKYNAKMARHEFDEVEAGYKRIAAEASEKARECERLDADIRRMTAERDKLSAELAQLKSRFFGG